MSKKILIIAGPNGEGKTTMTLDLLASGSDLYEFINADEIANTKTHSKHYIRRTRKLSEFNDRKRVNIELNMDPFAIVELRGFGVV